MASQSNDLRTSSPTPIPEILHYSAPTTTTRGTQPGHAELDTPPPNTQPPELKRSDRARNLSSRAQDILAATGKFVGYAQAETTEPQPAPIPVPAPAGSTSAKSQSAPSARAKQPPKRKRPTHRFNSEESGDDDDDGAPIKLKPARRRKTTKEDSPPPKAPGHRRATAGESVPSQRSVRLDADSLQNIGNIFGIDPKTATSRTVNETIRSLSDNRAPQVATSGRYTQVRGETAAPLSSLNKKGGGYYRNKLEALANPETSTKKRPHSGTDTESSKRARVDHEFDTHDISDASFPPLPAFMQREPHSVSSTQRAVVHPFQSQRQLVCPSFPERAYASQREREPTQALQLEPTRATQSQPTAAPHPDRVRFGHGLTPIPETRGFAALHRTPPPEPPRSTTGPRVLVAGTPTPPSPPAPEKRPPKAVPAQKPSAAPAKKTRLDTRTPSARRKEGSTTVSESELEPASIPLPKAKSKSGHRAPRADDGREERFSRTASQSSARRPHTFTRRDPSPAPPKRQPGPSSLRHPGPSSSKRHAHRHETDESNGERYQNRRATPSADDCSASGDEYDSPVDDSRSGLGRYPGRRGKVASRAIPALLSVAARKGVFQEHDINLIWAKKEFIRAWRKLYPRVKCPPPPDDLLCTIILRISGLRTDVKKRIRAVVLFLLRFRNPGSNEARMDANRKRCRHLLPNTFHCRDLVEDKDYYEHKVFIEAICEAFFFHKNSFAVRDQKNWQIIPLPAVAFVLTMMQDCIQEWDTGCFRMRENSWGTQKDIYLAHLHGLHVYEGEAGDRLLGFQSDWFKAGMEHAGIRIDSEESDPEFCQTVTRACFVRPAGESDFEADPEPEPEPEPEVEYVDGCLTAQSKGKGKAPRQEDDFSDY